MNGVCSRDREVLTLGTSVGSPNTPRPPVSLSVHVCVRERERERERGCVCVCVSEVRTVVGIYVHSSGAVHLWHSSNIV